MGALLAEQDDEWAISRRHMSLEVVAEAMAALPDHAEPEEGLMPIST